MSGTPSRTATACREAGGKEAEGKSPTEAHELHSRHRLDGRGGVGIQSPMTSGSVDVDAAGVGRKSRVLPWEICRSALLAKREYTVRAYRPANVQALDGRPPIAGSEEVVHARLVARAREAARPTEGVRQKSAEAILAACRR